MYIIVYLRNSHFITKSFTGFSKRNMKKLLLVLIIAITLVSCKKESDDNEIRINTWTFKAEGSLYQGELLWDPLLNTLLQSNDTYTFSMLGTDISANLFNIVISLADTTFTQPDYQSGIIGSDHVTSFFYGADLAGQHLFQSSNHNGAAIMNYKVESFDPSTKVLILSFSGNAEDTNGGVVAITDGKVRCQIEKM